MAGFRKEAVTASLLVLLGASGCAASKEEKYELKSPCVSADSPDPSPCARRPANPYHPYAVIPEQRIA
ncbi:MAG: hypothetical protein ABW189_07575 [Rickettsiales bacterium]